MVKKLWIVIIIFMWHQIVLGIVDDSLIIYDTLHIKINEQFVYDIPLNAIRVEGAHSYESTIRSFQWEQELTPTLYDNQVFYHDNKKLIHGEFHHPGVYDIVIYFAETKESECTKLSGYYLKPHVKILTIHVTTDDEWIKREKHRQFYYDYASRYNSKYFRIPPQIAKQYIYQGERPQYIYGQNYMYLQIQDNNDIFEFSNYVNQLENSNMSGYTLIIENDNVIDWITLINFFYENKLIIGYTSNLQFYEYYYYQIEDYNPIKYEFPEPLECSGCNWCDPRPAYEPVQDEPTPEEPETPEVREPEVREPETQEPVQEPEDRTETDATTIQVVFAGTETATINETLTVNVTVTGPTQKTGNPLLDLATGGTGTPQGNLYILLMIDGAAVWAPTFTEAIEIFNTLNTYGTWNVFELPIYPMIYSSLQGLEATWFAAVMDDNLNLLSNIAQITTTIK